MADVHLIVILTFHFKFSRGRLPKSFPTKTLYIFLVCSFLAVCSTHISLLYFTVFATLYDLFKSWISLLYNTLIWSQFYLYGRGKWYVTLEKGCNLQVFGNKVPRKWLNYIYCSSWQDFAFPVNYNSLFSFTVQGFQSIWI